MSAQKDPHYMSPTKEWTNKTQDLDSKSAEPSGRGSRNSQEPPPWKPVSQMKSGSKGQSLGNDPIAQPKISQVWAPDGRPPPESAAVAGSGMRNPTKAHWVEHQWGGDKTKPEVQAKSPFGRSVNSRGVLGQENRYAPKESVSTVVFSSADAPGVHANAHTGDFWQQSPNRQQEPVLLSDDGACSRGGRRHYNGSDYPQSNYKEVARDTDLLKSGPEGGPEGGPESGPVPDAAGKAKFCDPLSGKLYDNLYSNSQRVDCTGPDHFMGTAALRREPHSEPRQLKGQGYDGPHPAGASPPRSSATTTTSGVTRWGL